ncbi:MAG: glycosyltransferase family 87 protein [Pseudomonadota bacterium]
MRKSLSELDSWQQNALTFAVSGIVLFLPTIIRIYWPSAGLIDVTGHPIGRDFINVWIGPQVVANEGISALFDLRGYEESLGTYFGTPLPFHNWGYPLFVLPFYWPFAQMPYVLALAIWTVLFGAAFLWAAISPVDRARASLAALLIAISPAAIINTISGQNGFISGALLLGSMLLLDRRPIVAGVLIGLLIFKPHLGFCLPFVLIALGAWRTFVAASVTAAILLFYTIPFIGLDPWIEYVEKVSPYQALLLEVFEGYYTNMMVSITAGLRSMGMAYTPALAIQAIVSVGVLVTTVMAVRQTKDATVRAFVVATAVPLMTPYAFNYDLTTTAAAVAWLIVGPLAMPQKYRLLLFMVWLVPALVMMPLVRCWGVPQIFMLAIFAISVRMAYGWQLETEDVRDPVAQPAGYPIELR